MQVRIPGWASRRMRLRGGSMVGSGGGEGKGRVVVPGSGGSGGRWDGLGSGGWLFEGRV